MAGRMLIRLRQLNRLVAIAVGLGLLGCAGFILLDIALRQIGTSFGGTDEVSGYVMAIASSWGMGHAMLELGHVRIGILYTRFRQTGRVLFDLGAMLVLSGTITLIAVKCWPVLEKSLANASRANTSLETPLYWVQLPWLAGWIWFAAMAWLTFLAALTLVARRDFAASEAAIGPFGGVGVAK